MDMRADFLTCWNGLNNMLDRHCEAMLIYLQEVCHALQMIIIDTTRFTDSRHCHRDLTISHNQSTKYSLFYTSRTCMTSCTSTRCYFSTNTTVTCNQQSTFAINLSSYQSSAKRVQVSRSSAYIARSNSISRCQFRPLRNSMSQPLHVAGYTETVIYRNSQ
jgi:uncharacterized protein YpiB (UPF0302 family)